MRPAFRPARVLAAALLCLVALPALASTQPRRSPAAPVQPDPTAMCRAACLSSAAGAPGGVSPQAAQACTIRCGAAQSYLAQQGARGTAEATGRGRSAAPLALPVASGLPAPARPAAVGAIYGARAPSAAFGMVIGSRDRLEAHREAERICAARGPGCRVIAEVTAACGAAAQGIRRSQWALMITADPNSFVVTSISAGQGATQAQAEADAMAECRSRDPGAQCRVVAAACR